jgi:hypothetical protein
MELMEMSCRRPGETWSVPALAAPAVAGEQVAPFRPQSLSGWNSGDRLSRKRSLRRFDEITKRLV